VLDVASTYKLVIFDCDGVLVDSEPLALRVDVELFAELGWPLSAEEIARRFVGRTTEYMMGELAAHIGGAIPPEVDAKFAARYREVLAAELRPVDGIADALDRIAGLTCVASSGSHDKMRFTLGLTGLYERFEGRIFSASEVAHGKPAPDLFLHAAATLGVDPHECAVVEDSEYGVLAARAAGMTVFGYVGGDLIPAERLEGPGTTLFANMRDLPRLLGEDS
jgi:HAD superfamily hydrolase (TIGR01509 family)